MRNFSLRPVFASCTFVLLFFISGIIQAQVIEATPGYVILANQDSIRCQLNLESEVLMSQRIELDKGNGFEVVPASDILKAGFDQHDITLVQVPHTYFNNERQQEETGLRLARLLFDGPLKLYKLGVSANEYIEIMLDIPPWVYSLQTADGDFIKLDVKERQHDGTQNSIQEVYKGKFRFLFADWTTGQNRIDRLSFRDEIITDFIRDYCKFKYDYRQDQHRETKLVKPKVVKVQQLIRGLYAYNSSVIKTSNKSDNIGLGYAVSFTNPLVNNGLSLEVGAEFLLLSNSKETENASLLIADGYALRLPIRANYYLIHRESKVKPKINFGLIGTYTSYEGISRRTAFVPLPNGNVEFVVKTTPYDNKNVAIRYSVGAGLETGNFVFDLYYENRMNLLFSLGYRF